MWDPERVTITIHVDVNLDGVPGAFHTRESAQDIIAHILQDALTTRIPHYKPAVLIN